MTTAENLARLSRLIADKLLLLPRYDYRDLDTVRAHRAALAQLAEELTSSESAVIREESGGASVRLAGIKSTSTSGLIGALGNWRTAAQKKIAGGAA